jgi:hypothetical protein
MMTRFQRQRMTMFLGLGLLALLAIALVGGLLFIRRSQDLRQQASVAGGTVTITTVALGTPRPGQPLVIDLRANTQNAQVIGMQVGFDVTTDAPTLTIDSPNLQILGRKIDKIATGFRVQLAVAPAPPGKFSSNTATTFAKLNLTPVQAGQVKVTYNAAQSIVPNGSTGADMLKPVATATILVNNPSPSIAASPASSPSIVPSPSIIASTSPAPSIIACTADAKICPDGSSVGRDPLNGCQFKACPSPAPSPSLNPSPSPSAVVVPSPSIIVATVQPSPSTGASPSPSTTTKKRGDLNNDGKVNLLDYQIMNQEFFKNLTVFKADINGDKRVDLLDFSILNNEFAL